MGYGTKITEEKEYGDEKVIITKRIVPMLLGDDYQEMLTKCIDAVNYALNAGKKGDFGITFFVDPNKGVVKRGEAFYTESVERIEVES